MNKNFSLFQNQLNFPSLPTFQIRAQDFLTLVLFPLMKDIKELWTFNQPIALIHKTS